MVNRTGRSLQYSSTEISHKDFETYLKRLHSDKNNEKRKQSEESLPYFKLDLSELLESVNIPDVADIEQPEHKSRQEKKVMHVAQLGEKLWISTANN